MPVIQNKSSETICFQKTLSIQRARGCVHFGPELGLMHLERAQLPSPEHLTPLLCPIFTWGALESECSLFYLKRANGIELPGLFRLLGLNYFLFLSWTFRSVLWRREAAPLPTDKEMGRNSVDGVWFLIVKWPCFQIKIKLTWSLLKGI